jgi:YfiH family protein
MTAARRAEARSGPGVPEVEARAGDIPVVRLAAWRERFPGVTQGVTLRDGGIEFAVAGEPWARLRIATGARRVVRLRQVHGAVVRMADAVAASEDGEPADEGDALVTGTDGTLLAVTVADCVPVFVVDGEAGALGLAHAGWRGVAAGVLEAMLEMTARELGARVPDLYVHLGPAICGRCYEVGPEVPRALGLQGDPHRVDLRAVLRDRAASFGVSPDRITRSSWCTRCDRDRLYSHRGGDGAARSCGFLGRAPR